MKTTWVRALGAAWVTAALVALQGCGGGGSDTVATAPPPTAEAAASAVVQGRVLNTSDGAALAGAAVTLDGVSSVTDGQGRFTAEVPAGGPGVVRVRQAGFADAIARVPLATGSPVSADVWATPVGVTASLTPAGGDVSVPGSVARVSFPPSALANADGSAFTGTAQVLVTPIDPATRPGAMPGSFQARTATGTQAIESFGALQVTLRDAATGQPLKLAAGQTATLRIPVASRTLAPPASLPLYHLDETTGLWVEEGSATLAGTPGAAWYEGTVSHFSTWNADRPMETVFVDGCVRNADGSVAPGAAVQSEGVDYSGAAWALADAEGRFRVAVRKGGRAVVFSENPGEVTARVPVGPSASDIVLTQCLVLQPGGTPPVVTVPPADVTVLAGNPALFYALATGSRLDYQWQRDGVDLPGATGNVLVVKNPQLADSGAVYTVVVRNLHGAVTSPPAVLTVTPGLGAGDARAADIVRMAFVAFEAWGMALSPSEAADADLAATVAPSAVCRSGALGTPRFDGAAVTGGQPISQAAQHTLDVTFDDCEVEPGDRYTGRAAATFRYTSTATEVAIDAATVLTDFRSTEWETIGRGTFTTSTRTSLATDAPATFTVTPAAGASLEHRVSGVRATFTGGSYTMAFTSNTVQYTVADLGFTVDSKAYKAAGSLRLGPGGNGAVTVTGPDGVVGRLVIAGGGLNLEVGGITVPYVPERP